MPQQRLKIPCASTKTQHSQINKYFLKEYKYNNIKKKKVKVGKKINHRELYLACLLAVW